MMEIGETSDIQSSSTRRPRAEALASDGDRFCQLELLAHGHTSKLKL
jgi:hypothetical protein